MNLPLGQNMPVDDLQSEQVQLGGSYVDTVVAISEELGHMKDLLPLVKLLSLVYKMRSPSPDEECHMNALMRTLSGDALHKTTTDRHPQGFTRDEIVQSFQRLLGPVLTGLAGQGDLEQAVGAGQDPESFRQFWALDDRNLLTDAMSGRGALAATSEMGVNFLETFVEDKSRRLALTQDHGALVLVSNRTRVGDEVWRMSRSSSLVVVRREGRPEMPSMDMSVLGEAYSHGFAKGKSPKGCRQDHNDMEFLTSSVAVGLAGGVPM
ncbi:hypothetical protein CGRA01v4_04787 [Colletotrichum graminicola]|uniref:Uncharacterized protein n=1 Tax=Colletotrichum graminicola (strain M1.001 / M2 / FGSC 10212) TaxID=645133 RepID=E3QLL8_COLGM|nr:uncharacterized protein GLRG_06731 [Colletotrichum graminicola M1.001]EFQ31756.1 hypothetical protein GLRG_06731 [Colletotrichum graminicola M1.001]WDK13506.1 hypothetical protein CGRA01v4_04787 [Colletotrichum graminicola]